MLLAETATPLAAYDHPFFGRFPAITRNVFGKGTVTYQGTVLTDVLQTQVVADVLKQAGVTPDVTPPKVHVRHATARDGKALHFLLNFSSETQSLDYAYGPGTDLLTGNAITAKQRITIGPWDLLVVRE